MLKPSTVAWMRSELRRGALSRAQLAVGLCEQDDWRNRRGKPCLASARKALPRLAADLGLPLPEPTRRTGGCRRRPPQEARKTFPPLQLQCSLKDLRPVCVSPAETPEQRRHLASLLDAEHPLQRGQAPGCRLLYGIEAGGQLLGVISFVAAGLRLGPRDKHLGWDERTRGHNIDRLLCNDRFLVRPGVRVPNLASHAWGLVLKQLAADWEARHGVLPVAVETCVEQGRKGSSYKAAQFTSLGFTNGLAWGRGKRLPKEKHGRQQARKPPPQAKQVFVKGLQDGWEQVLRERPVRVLGQFPGPARDSGADWAECEFERSDLPDRRLRERLKAMGKAWRDQPGECVPTLFPESAEQRAAYRLLNNKRVTPEDVLQPHREALAERAGQQPGTVLLVQDTTTLNYTGLQECTEGLGPLKDRANSSRGLFVHAAVAFTPGRRSLGVSGLEVWARPLEEPADEGEKESRRWFRGLQQGFELGRACPGRQIVVVGDRESDIYDLFRERERREQAGEENVELLVRVNLGRQRKAKVRCPELKMEMVRPLPVQCDFQHRVQFRRTFRLLSQGGKRARRGSRVETKVSIGAVELQPPEARRKRGEAGVEAWLVHVAQTNARKGARPLEWLLLSTVGGPSKLWAQRIVRWYEARWSIEEFFKVLKSHARIEDRRLRTAEALAKCLVFDAITAWQAQSLGSYARDAPDTPAEQVLTQDERAMILAVVRKKRLLPPAERGRPPPKDIRSWVVWLARTVGFRPSKRRPLPGHQLIWRAYVKLQVRLEGWRIMRG